MVVLQAADPVEALRLRATRLFVIRRGRVIAQTPVAETTLQLGEETARITFSAHR
jgi:cytosine deaminase